MMTQTSKTYLIEENTFVREGLKALLQKSNHTPVVELDDVKKAAASIDREQCDLIILGTGERGDVELSSALEMLKAWFSDVHILILASELNMDLVKASFSAGADGFILKDISSEAFLHSLDLVALGEKVFPTALAALLLEDKNSDAANNAPRLPDDQVLSHRERDIVLCLERGDSNKIIARQLGITESTVKVHVKAILRKLGLKNRTQAAIWSMQHATPTLSLNDNL